MTYNVFSGTLNPTHFTSLLGRKLTTQIIIIAVVAVTDFQYYLVEV